LMESQSSCIFLSQQFILLSKNSSFFFLTIYFVFQPWNSVFSLFQYAALAHYCLFIWPKEFLFAGFLFLFFWILSISLLNFFPILYHLLYFIHFFSL
jgi:hypothetical protein